MQHHAEHLGLISLASFGLSCSHPQRLDCLHFMVWHTEAAVIPPKIPRKSNRLSQKLNSTLWLQNSICGASGVDFSFPSSEGIWKFILSYILIPWKRKSRHQQTGGGESEENLHPHPEITECGSWNPCDAQTGHVSQPLIYSSSGGPGLRPSGLCGKNKFCCLSAFNLKFTPFPKRHVFPPSFIFDQRSPPWSTNLPHSQAITWKYFRKGVIQKRFSFLELAPHGLPSIGILKRV